MPKLLLVLLLLLPLPLRGQEIVGRVLDASTDQPISSALVTATAEGEEVARALTGPAGRFVLQLDGVTQVEVTASVIGYRTSTPTPVDVLGVARRVEVEIRLATEAIEIEGLSVVARGVALRHLATPAGFQERYRNRHRVGAAKLYMGNDPLVMASSEFTDVLRTSLVDFREVAPPVLGSAPRRQVFRCTVVYLDGRPRRSIAAALAEQRTLGQIVSGERPPLLANIAGIEIYRDRMDAPMEMRGSEPPCLLAPFFSVIAIWTGEPTSLVDPALLEKSPTPTPGSRGVFQIRLADEATGEPLDGRVFWVESGSSPQLIGRAVGGVAEVELPSSVEGTLMARVGGYFDSAPVVVTPAEREQGVAFIWVRHVDPARRADAIAAARAAAAIGDEGEVQRIGTDREREMAVKVRDGEGNPLAQVQVWADTVPLGITDGSGFFRTTFDEPIRTEIRLTRLGLGEVSARIDFEQSSEGVLLQTTMRPEAIELEAITVTAVPRRMLADVTSIQQSILQGRGSFVARESIELRAFPPVASLVQGFPGVTLRNGVPFSRRAPECSAMALFVDGVAMPGDNADFFRTGSMDVELVEIHPGGGSVPARYQQGTTRCGVVAVWTRRGGEVQLSDLLEFRPGREEGRER